MNHIKYDLLIVGAGIVGLAHAWIASKLGLHVAILEKNPRCEGASIKNFGFVTVTGQRAGTTWERARKSRDLWLEVAFQAHLPICQRGLTLVAHRSEALEILETFQQTSMGDDCRLLTREELIQFSPELRSERIVGGLYSPLELRFESQRVIPQIAQWLSTLPNIDFFYSTEVLQIETPHIETSSGIFSAERVLICPGNELHGVAKKYLQQYPISLTQLQMLRIKPLDNYRLKTAIMGDFSLVRYAGFTGLDCHHHLLQRLKSEHGPALDAGIHFIAVQSLDGSLVIGDSHHQVLKEEGFASEEVDRLILQICEETLALKSFEITHRWIGRYPTGIDSTDALILKPEETLRVVSIVSGTGASTAFGIAEEVIHSWGF